VVARNTSKAMAQVDAVTSAEEILQFQHLVKQVPIADDVIKYAVELVRASRPTDPLAPDIIKKYVNYGCSVRATQFLVMAAKARALMEGRYHVSYEDLHHLVLPVMRHRLLTNFHAESDQITVDDILRRLIEARPTPRT
jgi:MoxR-like ATPase